MNEYAARAAVYLILALLLVVCILCGEQEKDR